MSDKYVSPLSSADSKNTQKRKNRIRSHSSLSSRSSRKHNSPIPALAPGMFYVVKHGEGGGKLTNDVGRSPESFAQEEDVCCICHEHFKGRMKKYMLSECKHVIHKTCLIGVCKTDPRCPLCRNDIRADCREIIGHKKGEMPGHIISKIITNEKKADLLLYNKIDKKRIDKMITYLLVTKYPKGTDFNNMRSFGQAILDEDRLRR